MRLPPNLKYFIGFILAIGIIIWGTIYIPKIIPDIGKILVNVISIGMLVLVSFVMLKLFLTFIYARADGIFEVYMDKSEKGLHIFSYHLNASGEGYGESSRDIQHYFILIETGKIYFKKMFTHLMVPASGRSGWGDFYGFEESVLKSNSLTQSLKKLSAKSKITLQLGRNIKSFSEDIWELQHNEYLITIKKYSNPADEGFRVICTIRNNEETVWKNKI